jgi:hypothetical protein
MKEYSNRTERALVRFATVGLLLRARGANAALITVDENGNGIGTVGVGSLKPDPGPGGLPSVLT